MCSTSTVDTLVNRISKFSWQSHKRRVCQLIIDFAIPHSKCPRLFSNIFLWLEASCEQPRELHEIFRQDGWIQLRSTRIEQSSDGIEAEINRGDFRLVICSQDFMK